MLRFHATLIALVLGACGAPAPSPSGADGTPPERPVAPAGWIVISSHAGDAELTVPPDLGLFGPDTPVGVRVQAPVGERHTPLQTWAHGPSALPAQPDPGESLRSWLERGTWFPSREQGAGAAMADFSEREVLLPAGRALELAATVQPGTREASRVVAYAIEAAGGFAVLQVIGEPEDLEARSEELGLIPLLVRFGD